MDEVYDGVYICNRQQACEASKTNIDTVITVCQDGISETVPGKYYHFELRDGSHDRERFKEAVEATLKHIEKGDTIIVHCHEGISRSPSVVIAALSIHLKKDVREVTSMIQDKRPVISPAPELWDSIKDVGVEEIPYTN